MASRQQWLLHGFRIPCVRRDRAITGDTLLACAMNNPSFDALLAAMVSLSRGRLWSSEVIMCIASKNERGVIELLQDPLIRLVMDSDGVTEQAMIATLEISVLPV